MAGGHYRRAGILSLLDICGRTTYYIMLLNYHYYIFAVGYLRQDDMSKFVERLTAKQLALLHAQQELRKVPWGLPLGPADSTGCRPSLISSSSFAFFFPIDLGSVFGHCASFLPHTFSPPPGGYQVAGRGCDDGHIGGRAGHYRRQGTVEGRALENVGQYRRAGTEKNIFFLATFHLRQAGADLLGEAEMMDTSVADTIIKCYQKFGTYQRL